MAKKKFKAHMIMRVAVREVRCDKQYEGELRDPPLKKPLAFKIVFTKSVNAMNLFVCVAEAMGASETSIARVLCEHDPYKFTITHKDGRPLSFPSPEDLDLFHEVMSKPVLMAIALLRKQEGTAGTFRVPCLAAEDMEQLESVSQLEEYVFGLNAA